MTVLTGLRPFFAVWPVLWGVLMCAPAWGHATGENYVWLNARETHVEGHFEIRLDDLRHKLAIDLPTDYDQATAQIAATAPVVQKYIQDHFTITAEGEVWPIRFTKTGLFKSNRLGHFAQYYYRTDDRPVPDRLTIRNNLLFENDRFHRGLLCMTHNAKTGKQYGGEYTAMVFSPSNNEQVLDLTNVGRLFHFGDFVWQGMLHIWIGIDHILFLLALLLPAVLVRKDNAWESVENFRKAFWNILKIVTVFTLAHSITLALAAMDIVQVPSRFVESAIALSIVLVALNNIFPTFRESALAVIFLFGLFHGLGFATVMGHLPFRMKDTVSVLIAFNIGVELGQMVIVAGVFPLIFWLRRLQSYPTVVLRYGSIALCLVGAYWFVERAMGLG